MIYKMNRRISVKKLVKYSALLALTLQQSEPWLLCSASNMKSESGKSDEKKVTVEIAAVGTTSCSHMMMKMEN